MNGSARERRDIASKIQQEGAERPKMKADIEGDSLIVPACDFPCQDQVG